MERFSKNDIIALLDDDPRFNLGESTSRDLMLGELLDADVIDRLGRIRLGYGTSLGHHELRKHIAGVLAVPPESVVITVGGASALFMITFVLCEPGDEIVVTTPNFPPTIEVMRAVGTSIRPIRLGFASGYRPRLEDFETALTPRTKLVSLATPQNPSGVAIPEKVCEGVLQIMSNICPDAFLLVDESYREAVYGEGRVPSSTANLSARVITTASLSKCHGAPGLRIGWLTCHDPKLVEQLVLAKMNTVISCSVVDEFLALEVLRRGSEIFHARREGLQEAVRKVENWVESERDLIAWVRPDGGAMCCVRLRPEVFSDADAKRFYKELRLRDALVANGSWFGDEERVFRLGFGFLPPAELGEALTATSEALRASLN